MFNALSLQDIRSTKDVVRWHMIRTKRQQNLAEHSYQVALIAGKLSELLGEPLTTIEERDLLRLALLHDIEEIEFGDIPTPTKKKIREAGHGDILTILEAAFWSKRGSLSTPEFHASTRVRALVRLADLIEAALFYNEEGEVHDIKRRITGDALFYAERNFPGESNEKLRLTVKEIL